MKKGFTFIFLIINFVSGNSSAQCGLYKISLAQKVSESNFILEGVVVKQQAFKSVQKNKIFTRNTIKVLSVYKGNLPQSIDIITAGGKLNNELEIASSLLSLGVSQTGMFFLNKESVETENSTNDVYNVYASAQGFYNYNLSEQLISDVFEEFSKTDFYDVLEGEYNLKVSKVFGPVNWSNSSLFNRLTVINNFSPTLVNAGIGNQITINGFGFGSVRGSSTVLFKNANNGGATEIAAEASQYVSWSNSKIVVFVPHNAGTGKIAVKVNNDRAQSSASLQIKFAIINTGSSDLVHAPRHVARNANKGYVWNMNENFESDSIAKANFLISFKQWRCKTYINWSIGDNTSINSSVRDTLSVISFDENNELPLGVLGLCYGYYSGCSNDDWYIEEQDLLFRKSNLWHFGDGVIPSNKVDFQSVALHELGHAHQLAHVIDISDLMHYSINNGVQKRSIESSNMEAAQWIMSKSQESDICNKKKMQLLDVELCNDENFGFFNTVIYPNPFNELLNIDFYLSSNNKLNVFMYDVTGKLITSYKNENALKGFFPLVFDVPNHMISAGVYILKIEIGEEKIVKKLIKQ
jgi:hypothetical protein